MPQATLERMIASTVGQPTAAELAASVAALWPTGPVVVTYQAGDWIHRSNRSTSARARFWLLLRGQVEAWRDEAYLSARGGDAVLGLFAGIHGGAVSYDARAVGQVEVVEVLNRDVQAFLASADPLLDKAQEMFRRALQDEAQRQSTSCALAVQRLSFPVWSPGQHAYDRLPARSARLRPLPQQDLRVLMLPVHVEVAGRLPPSVVTPVPARLPGWFVLARGLGTDALRRTLAAVTVDTPGGLHFPIGLWSDRAVDLVALREHLGIDAMIGHVEVEGASVGARQAVLRADSEHAFVAQFEVTNANPSPFSVPAVSLLSWLRRFHPRVFATGRRAANWDPADFLIDALFEIPLQVTSLRQVSEVALRRCTPLSLDGATLSILPRAATGYEFQAEVRVGSASKVRDYRTTATPAERRLLAWTPGRGTVRYRPAGKLPAARSPATGTFSTVAQAIDAALKGHPALPDADRAAVVPLLAQGATFLQTDGTFYQGYGDIRFAIALAAGAIDETFSDVPLPRHAGPRFIVGTRAFHPLATGATRTATGALGRVRTYLGSYTVSLPTGPVGLMPPFRVRTLAGLPPHRFLVTRAAAAVRVSRNALAAAMAANPNFHAFAVRRAALRGALVLTQTGLRHEEITQQVFSGSKGRYIPGPYIARKARFTSVPVRFERAAVEPWLPPGLELVPGLPGVLLYSEFSKFDQSEMASGRDIRYDETGLAVFVRCPNKGIPRAFFPWLAPGNLMAQTIGREAYGYSKVLQGVDIRGGRVRIREASNEVHSFDRVRPTFPLRTWLMRRMPVWSMVLLGAPMRLLCPRAAGRRASELPGLPIPVVGWIRVRNPEIPTRSPTGRYQAAAYALDGLVEHLIDISAIDWRAWYPVPRDLSLTPHSGSAVLKLRSLGYGVTWKGRLSLLPVKDPVVLDYGVAALTAADEAILTP